MWGAWEKWKYKCTSSYSVNNGNFRYRYFATTFIKLIEAFKLQSLDGDGQWVPIKNNYSFQLFDFLINYFLDIIEPNQIFHQNPANNISEVINNFHNYIMMILIAVLIAVTYLMIQSFLGDLYSRNLTDHPKLELIWTIIPAIILLFIAFPSLHLLYVMDEVIEPSVSIKAIGNQWYWSYEYGDYADYEIEFQSYMVSTQDLKEGDIRLREVDNRVVVPVNSNVKVLTTSNDVIHCWAVPSLGVKVDSLPGRLNQTSFTTNRPGLFLGACSEICGSEHSFMPISVESVSMNLFAKWILSFS